MDPRKDPSNSRPAGHHQTPQGELGRVLLLFGENRQVLQAMEENEEGCRGRQGASGRIHFFSRQSGRKVRQAERSHRLSRKAQCPARSMRRLRPAVRFPQRPAAARVRRYGMDGVRRARGKAIALTTTRTTLHRLPSRRALQRILALKPQQGRWACHVPLLASKARWRVCQRVCLKGNARDRGSLHLG